MILTKEIFNREIAAAQSIAVLAHTSPDGDAIGSALAIYNYVANVRGARALPPAVYLDDPQDKFSFLRGFDLVRTVRDDETYELVIVTDCADTERMGRFIGYYRSAGKSLVIDHHVTNPGFGDYFLVEGEASSSSEVAYSLFDEDYVDKAVAECIYTGIVHDTGGFRYSMTHESTMLTAGRCMAKGIDFGAIMEDTYFSLTLSQQKVLGYILSHIETGLDGRFVYSALDLGTRLSLAGEDVDLDGMIDKIRVTVGAEVAAFIYETRDGRVKASLRSNTDAVDVSRVALVYGGGGHRRAAGCFMSADIARDIAELTEHFRAALPGET